MLSTDHIVLSFAYLGVSENKWRCRGENAGLVLLLQSLSSYQVEDGKTSTKECKYVMKPVKSETACLL